MFVPAVLYSVYTTTTTSLFTVHTFNTKRQKRKFESRRGVIYVVYVNFRRQNTVNEIYYSSCTKIGGDKLYIKHFSEGVKTQAELADPSYVHIFRMGHDPLKSVQPHNYVRS